VVVSGIFAPHQREKLLCCGDHYLAERIAHTPLGAVTEVYYWVKVHNTESDGTQRLLVVG
jgi:hypothetical protein